MRSIVTGSTGTLRSKGPPGSRRAMTYLVDDFHALDDGAENRIAPTCWPRIEIEIVGQVDIELARAGVRFVGAREADCSAQIAQAVAGFVDDRAGRGLRIEIGRVAAGLRDETGDDTMKHRARIKTRRDVFQERLDGERCARAVEPDHELALVRINAYLGIGRQLEGFL